MDKFKLDTNELEGKLNAPKMFKLEDVKDKIRKIAFDVVTFRDNPETLWKIVPGDDGEYIVANYPLPDDAIVSQSYEESVKLSWSVETDRLNKTATIFYKTTPITNLPLSKITVDDSEDFKFRIPKLLSKNASLVEKMIDGLDQDYKNQVLSLHPELKK